MRLDAGILSSRHERQLRQWIAIPGNTDALDRAAGTWNDIDRAVLADRVEAVRFARRSPAGSGRRYRSIAVSAGVLGIVLAITFVPGLWIAARADARTDVGESRLVVLADGSRVLLDSQSAVDIVYSDGERRIRLLQGRAEFDVAPNRNRPFLVEARGGATRALGTTFSVDMYQGDVQVDAIRHDISVTLGSNARILHPGQSIRYGDRLEPTAIAENPDGWTHGLLAFDDARLADVAEALQRYTSRRIVIWGAARERRYSGVIRTADPMAGLHGIGRADRLHLTFLPWMVVVTTR